MIEKNSTICFFGDSITAHGFWIKQLWENLRDVTQRLFNCGVPGDSAKGGLARIYDTCLIYSPDYVTVMFGMNDIDREIYGEEGTEKKREAAIIEYEKNMCRIVETILNNGAKPILMTPTPYDEISNNETVNLRCNSGLDRCCAIVKNIAKKYDVALIDLNSKFSEAMERGEGVVGEDRVHPNLNGHSIMAKAFAELFGFELKELEESEQNKLRFEVEQKLTDMGFIEYCLLFQKSEGKRLSLAERKEIISECYREIKAENNYVKGACKYYLDNIDYKNELIKELVKNTLSTREK